uniref:L-Fucosyltransferase n=1 Tax=Acrobeloides nanus TaxID=290746 RepID=A0A914DX98_9BILA
MKEVNDFARYLFKNDSSHLLCAHIRRGDFIGFSLEEATKEFILPALEFITTYLKNAGHNNLSLLFIGNDLKFVQELNLTNYNFSSIYTPEPLSKGGDMCLGANYCKSMLISASGSTYGWWMSYLMPENSTVFYNSRMTRNRNEINDKERYDYNVFLKEWISLAVENGTAYHEKKWWHEREKEKKN